MSGAGSQEPRNSLRGRYSVSAPPRAPITRKAVTALRGSGTRFNSPREGSAGEGGGPGGHPYVRPGQAAVQRPRHIKSQGEGVLSLQP